MADFYEHTLGLKPNPKTRSDDWVEFDAEGTIFALHAIPAEHANGVEITSHPEAREQSATKLCFFVDNLPAERARLTTLGVIFIDRPWDACDALDPEGNVFQLCS